MDEVLEGPVIVRLRFTVESVLDDQELSTMRSTDHEWVKAESRDRAGIFTADVDEDRASCFIFTVDIVLPVSLFVGSSRLVVEMINLSIEESHSEIIFRHNRKILREGRDSGNECSGKSN